MKKALALLLVVVMALGMSTTAFAADTRKLTKEQTGSNPAWDGYGRDLGDEVRPGQEFKALDVVWGDFDVTAGLAAATSANLFKSDITRSKLTIRTKIAKGSVALDEIVFEYDSNKFAYINIVMVDPFKNNNTDGLDFDFTVYPVIDGKQYPNNGANYTGTLLNYIENIDAETYYIDMSPGTIAEVDEYVKEVEYDMGEGVSLFGKAIKNAKYWGVADTDPNEAQDEIMTKYDIDSVYTISQIGLAGICNYVRLNDSDPSAYVYDGNLKYLGRASEKLAYADVYYLATKQLDVEDDEEEPEDDDPSDEPVAPPEGGGDGYPENVNDNPGTGK